MPKHMKKCPSAFVLPEDDKYKYLQLGKATLRVIAEPLTVEVRYPNSTWRALTITKVPEFAVSVRPDPGKYVGAHVRVVLARLLYKLYVDPAFALFYSSGSQVLKAVDGDRSNMHIQNWMPAAKKYSKATAVIAPTEPAVKEEPPQESLDTEKTASASVYMELFNRAQNYAMQHVACQAALYAALSNSGVTEVSQFRSFGIHPSEFRFMGIHNSVLTLGSGDSAVIYIELTDAPEFII